MSTTRSRYVAYGLTLLGALVGTRPLHAQVEVGTWVRKVGPATPGVVTMTITACCGAGRHIEFRMNGGATVMTVESQLDGREAPVLVDGKPSGETMAIRRVDAHHTSTVVTLNGQPFGTSKATLSADGRTITVDNDFTPSVGGQQSGKFTEVWVRE